MKTILTRHFKKLSLNHCSTQTLNKMAVEKISVEFKNGKENLDPIRMGRIYPIPIHLVDRVKKDLDTDVTLGILEKVEERLVF